MAAAETMLIWLNQHFASTSCLVRSGPLRVIDQSSGTNSLRSYPLVSFNWLKIALFSFPMNCRNRTLTFTSFSPITFSSISLYHVFRFPPTAWKQTCASNSCSCTCSSSQSQIAMLRLLPCDWSFVQRSHCKRWIHSGCCGLTCPALMFLGDVVVWSVLPV